jgi:hypothetical protein
MQRSVNVRPQFCQSLEASVLSESALSLLCALHAFATLQGFTGEAFLGAAFGAVHAVLALQLEVVDLSRYRDDVIQSAGTYI